MVALSSTNPSNNQVLGKVEQSTEQEIVQKVAEAHKAKKDWKDLGLEGRIKLLRGVVNKISKRKGELAKLATQEMGMPITQAEADVEDGIHFMNWYLDNAPEYLCPEEILDENGTILTVYYEPIGVAVVITPWNFPLSNFVWSAVQNLIVGNPVIYKASEECLLFGKLLEEVISSAKLPAGVFSQVHGDGSVGDLLVHQDINLISFTGSTKTGKYLYKLAGEKFIKAVCELGGSAPGVVFEDADLDQAIEHIYSNRFTNCGQMCDALKRLIVHESVYDKVLDLLKKRLEPVKVGDPESKSTELGPLVSTKQLELLEEQVQEAVQKGAKVVCGGKRPKHLTGAFYEPTLLTGVTRKMRVWQEEVFGPVLPVVSFATDEEAIELANDTRYGLGSYIYSKDKKNALKTGLQIDAGMVSINSAGYIQACSPFGGYKESGMGREHGKFGFYELAQVKVVSQPN